MRARPVASVIAYHSRQGKIVEPTPIQKTFGEVATYASASGDPSGERTLTLATSAGLVRGSQLRADATLSDTSAPAQRARAPEVTEIDGLEPLGIAMALGPDPAAVGEQLRIELTVSNTGAAALSSVTLWLRWPHPIDPLFLNQGTGNLSGCSQMGGAATCSPG